MRPPIRNPIPFSKFRPAAVAAAAAAPCRPKDDDENFLAVLNDVARGSHSWSIALENPSISTRLTRRHIECFILRNLHDSRKLDEAISVLGKMLSAGIKPTVYTHNMLISGQCKLGKLSAAETLFLEVNKKGLSPTVVTYTSLIDGYCKQKEMDKAFQLYHEMTGKGISPNIHTFTALIYGLYDG